ncbi:MULTISPECIES: DNA N-6-adenine-methyltransferase [Halorussus]|uniref:DNA N-6-adenine-methyltransferase n=1 Tax=Halorussus TaxID=1070314 RepID=UPI0034A2EF60
MSPRLKSRPTRRWFQMTEQSTDATAHGVRLGHEQDPTDNEYATPPKIWRPLARAVDGFDTDPASGAELEPIAPTRYTTENDGLRQGWDGWVWLNPPWSSNGDGNAKKKKWARKARNEAARDTVDGVVMLLPCDTSSHVFHDHVAAADVFCLVGPGRIPFRGEDRNPSFELVLAVYADDVPGDLVDALNQLGIVVEGRTVVNEHPQTELGGMR